MADWTAPVPVPPPGQMDPAPKIHHPGWAPWVDGITQDAFKQKYGGAPPTGFVKNMIVKRDEEETIVPVSGTTPTQWEKDNEVTWETEPPEPYRDFTRFKRKYASITYRYYKRVTVTVLIVFMDGTSWKSDPPYVFWEPTSGPQTSHDSWVKRWVHTSGLNWIQGQTGLIKGRWRHAIPPDDRYAEPTLDDLNLREALPYGPPAKLLGMARPVETEALAMLATPPMRAPGYGWRWVERDELERLAGDSQWVSSDELGGAARA